MRRLDFFQLITLFLLLFLIQDNNNQRNKTMIKNAEISVLVNRAESEAVK